MSSQGRPTDRDEHAAAQDRCRCNPTESNGGSSTWCERCEKPKGLGLAASYAASPLDYLVEANEMRPVRFFATDALEITSSYDVVSGDCFDRDRDLPDPGKRVAVVSGDTVLRGTVVEICFLVEVERGA